MIQIVALRAEGGDLHHFLGQNHTHRAMFFSCQDQIIPGKQGFDLLRFGGST